MHLLYGALQPRLTFKKSKPYKINFYVLPVNSPGTSAIKLSTQTIYSTLKVEPIRKVIKNISLNFFNNVPTNSNPGIFNVPD